MPYYFTTLILLVVSVIFAVISLALEGKRRVAFGVGTVAAVITALISFATMSIPKPEIYTTNGNSVEDNELYFKTEWPLTVKYSLVYNRDPMIYGEEFKEKIPISRSVEVSAKATLFGIKWSELESKYLILGDNNELAINDPDAPGASIMKISAYLVGSRYYPGDVLSQEDIKVEGETLAGDKVVIEDYSFSPDVVVEGKNEIQITYKNLEYTIKGSIADKALIESIFAEHKPAVVVNLAAQAGVRYSITNPDVYIESNLIGFYNILEACRHSYDNGEIGVEHLVYASSSSVYGSNKKVPYSTDDKVDNPVSLYAATKKSNELLAHAYSKLYNIPSTGLRFFTVYGPAGRPDMAYFGFTNKLIKGETIQIFNYGNCKRDFTYVDDIVEGVKRVMQHAPEKETGEDGLPLPPYAVYNIGNRNPENLLDFVTILQEELIRAKVLPEDYDFEAHKKLVPMQPGDVPVTYADTSALERDFGFKPSTSLRDGLRKFAEWYKEFYNV